MCVCLCPYRALLQGIGRVPVESKEKDGAAVTGGGLCFFNVPELEAAGTADPEREISEFQSGVSALAWPADINQIMVRRQRTQR